MTEEKFETSHEERAETVKPDFQLNIPDPSADDSRTQNTRGANTAIRLFWRTATLPDKEETPQDSSLRRAVTGH
jgi:hypothetical protein